MTMIFGVVFVTQFLFNINYNVLLSNDFNAIFVNIQKISYFESFSNKIIINDDKLHGERSRDANEHNYISRYHRRHSKRSIK